MRPRIPLRNSPVRFRGVPIVRLQVSRYWVYSPWMDKGTVLALEKAGEWDRTEVGGTPDKSEVLERGRFPYVPWDRGFAFAVKKGRESWDETWWEVADWAQQQEREGGYRPGGSWHSAIGPETVSPHRGSQNFRRRVSHWEVEAEVDGEVYPVTLRQLRDDERDRCWCQLVEAYEPYGQSRREMLVFVAQRESP